MTAAIPKDEFDEEEPDKPPQAQTQGERIISNAQVEGLRKYHLELAFLRAMQGIDDPDANWKVRKIINHRTAKADDSDDEQTFFQVQWYEGDKQWIHMDDLRLHDPVAVIKYGTDVGLLQKPGWEWSHQFLP